MSKLSDRLLVRFTEAQRARIVRVTDYLGGSMTEFIRAATMREVEVVEEKIRLESEEKGLRRRQRFPDFGTPTASAPAAVAPAPARRDRQPASALPGADVACLAKYVLGARDPVERSLREDTVARVIMGMASSREEAHRIAAVVQDHVRTGLSGGVE